LFVEFLQRAHPEVAPDQRLDALEHRTAWSRFGL